MCLSIKVLTNKQVEELYEKSLKVDFPENERKPLDLILHKMEEGVYEPLGVAQGDEILGYTFFFRSGKDYLLDYYAILGEHRNKGLGSRFLSLIAEYYKDADSVICEVEDPTCALSQEEEDIQKRRYAFYLRNGFRDTEVRTRVFGADYNILEIKKEKEPFHSAEEILEIYLRIYREMLPEKWFKEHVEVRK